MKILLFFRNVLGITWSREAMALQLSLPISMYHVARSRDQSSNCRLQWVCNHKEEWKQCLSTLAALNNFQWNKNSTKYFRKSFIFQVFIPTKKKKNYISSLDSMELDLSLLHVQLCHNSLHLIFLVWLKLHDACLCKLLFDIILSHL